ncbi:uncharacterized protein LOC122036087 [Zingiber officinale]|uniref:uncharacterized protein LOC122036087 n=1 Tax=Zingiber officinale TaxID=94328 RepID=UPI001C4C5D11|nr:uncharacterized protein LOC122036087 [Zingiber officinale]
MSNITISSTRKDIAWNYATCSDPKNPNVVSCIFCGKITNGGIYRHKLHLIGGNRNVKACPKCPEHVKEEIREFMQKKNNLKNQMDEIPHSDDVDNLEDLEEDEEVDHQTKVKGKRPISDSSNHPTTQGKKCKQTGPINLYFMKDVDEIVKQRRAKSKGQFDENKKKLRDIAVEKFARWMYDAGIPFNAVKYDSFEPCIEAIGQFGSGMKPPSYHEVRVKYLKKELANTNSLLKSHEEDHAKFGCTIMADGWTDKKGRTLINFLVNGPKGSVFVESVDASGYSHTADKMFELLSKFVYRIGEKNVVQIVTDNASCNVSAGRLLENRFPHLYWTPCAAHCLDLLLEDIFKIPHLRKLHERALMVNGYIYNRPQVLSMMREFTGQRDMVRTAKTRFATAFLTLKRFHVQQANLRKMFTSEKWANSRFSKEVAGKRVAEVILMPSFWKNMVFALKVGGPLVKVLRLVDGEKRSPMGYIYEAMDRPKKLLLHHLTIMKRNIVAYLNSLTKDGTFNCIDLCTQPDIS